MGAEDRVIGEAVIAPLLRRSVPKIDDVVLAAILLAARAVPDSIAQAVGVFRRNAAMSDNEEFAVIGQIVSSIDVGDNETVAVHNTPDACAIQAAFGVPRIFEKQLEARYVTIDAGIDFELRPDHAASPRIRPRADIGDGGIRTGINPRRMAEAVELVRLMRHAARRSADINIFYFVSILRDFKRVFIELHREPRAPALNCIIVEI